MVFSLGAVRTQAQQKPVWYLDVSARTGAISAKSFSVLSTNAALCRLITPNVGIGLNFTLDDNNLYTAYFQRGNPRYNHYFALFGSGSEKVQVKSSCFGLGPTASANLGRHFWLTGALSFGTSQVTNYDTVQTGGGWFTSANYQSHINHAHFCNTRMDMGWYFHLWPNAMLAPSIGYQRNFLRGFDPYNNLMIGFKIKADLNKISRRLF